MAYQHIAFLLVAKSSAKASAPWLAQHMPAELRTTGPLDLAFWQWLGLPVSLVVGGVAGIIAAAILQVVLRFLARQTKPTWDDALVSALRGPLRLLLTAIGAEAAQPLLGLPDNVSLWVDRGLAAIAAVAIFWAVLRAVDVACELASASPWAAENPASRTLITIGRRIGKVLIVALAVGTALSVFGVSVASLIAGLGVGGLAVALAAQKSFENLLGAFAIGVDQPFREGDVINVDGAFTGTVERVGLRSTQIRTLDRTVISLPNGQLSEKRIETFAARDRIRIHAVLGMTYSTTPAQMRAIMEALKDTLKNHEKVWQDEIYIRFISFGASSLDIEVMCWINTTAFAEFADVRSALFLTFMDIVEQNGGDFAFPTRTVHVVGDKDALGGAPERPRP